MEGGLILDVHSAGMQLVPPADSPVPLDLEDLSGNSHSSLVPEVGGGAEVVPGGQRFDVVVWRTEAGLMWVHLRCSRWSVLEEKARAVLAGSYGRGMQ